MNKPVYRYSWETGNWRYYEGVSLEMKHLRVWDENLDEVLRTPFPRRFRDLLDIYPLYRRGI